MNSKYNIKTFVQKFPTHMIKICLDIFVENLHFTMYLNKFRIFNKTANDDAIIKSIFCLVISPANQDGGAVIYSFIQ